MSFRVKTKIFYMDIKHIFAVDFIVFEVKKILLLLSMEHAVAASPRTYGRLRRLFSWKRKHGELFSKGVRIRIYMKRLRAAVK